MATADPVGRRAIFWHDGNPPLLEQMRHQGKEVWLDLSDFRNLLEATQGIQGAPAVGVAGAGAVALAVKALPERQAAEFMPRIGEAAETIRVAQPNDANLANAMDASDG